jgi:predicted DNA binding CopG/RHH family protein
MKKNYDFSKAAKNPYAKRLKRELTINLDEETISYFQNMAEDLAIPHQTLINMYLRECADSGKRLRLHWKTTTKSRAA